MNLNIWIQKNYRFQKEFAEMLGVSQVRLSRLINGKAKPGDGELADIMTLTEGKVTERDFK